MPFYIKKKKKKKKTKERKIMYFECLIWLELLQFLLLIVVQ